MVDYFKNAEFITSEKSASVIVFKNEFFADEFKKATLYVCGLGFAYYYLNGEKVSDEVFGTPFSDYSKTLYVNKYDVTRLLKNGRNVFAARLGNGMYNEGVVNSWGFEKAGWKGEKQLIASLFVDGKQVFFTDSGWLCRSDDFYLYNDLRIGEKVDFNKLDESLYRGDDFTGFYRATVSKRLNGARFKLNNCPRVREKEEIKPIKTYVFGDRKVVDFGRIFSGYVKLKCRGEKGNRVKLLYAEDFDGENLVWHNMGMFYTSDMHVQSNEIILSGGVDVFKPVFSYNGFRYVEITGEIDDNYEISAYFVHADIKRNSGFFCSDEIITNLYNAAINSSLSNTFSVITDCPSREKLPWINDLACSTEQFSLDFKMRNLFAKIAADIADSQTDEGLIGGIAPTYGWGYNYGCGMTASSLFEIADCRYKLYSDDSFIKKYFPNMLKFYDYYYPRALKEEKFCYLSDWLGYRNGPADEKFVELCYALYFQEKLIRFSEILGENRLKDKFISGQKEIYKKTERYLCGGNLVLEDFTSLCLSVRFNIGNSENSLIKLEKLLNQTDFAPVHGLIGFRFFIDVIERYGKVDLLLKLLKSDSGKFVKMLEKGDSLWEHDNFSAHALSFNHHMFSCFVPILFKCVLGLNLVNSKIVFNPVKNVPFSLCGGSLGTGKNKVCVKISRENGTAEITVPKDNFVFYKNEYLPAGVHKFSI